MKHSGVVSCEAHSRFNTDSEPKHLFLESGAAETERRRPFTSTVASAGSFGLLHSAGSAAKLSDLLHSDHLNIVTDPSHVLAGPLATSPGCSRFGWHSPRKSHRRCGTKS